MERVKVNRVYVDAEGHIEDGHGHRFEDQAKAIHLILKQHGEGLVFNVFYTIEPIQVEFVNGNPDPFSSAWISVARIVTEEEKPESQKLGAYSRYLSDTEIIQIFEKPADYETPLHSLVNGLMQPAPVVDKPDFEKEANERYPGVSGINPKYNIIGRSAFVIGAEYAWGLRQKSHQPTEWMPVTTRPLYKTTRNGWEVTEDGEGEFWAAVPLKDGTWWIKHCVVEDRIGLCVVCNEDTEPAGFDLEDVTHFIPISLPEPPKP